MTDMNSHSPEALTGDPRSRIPARPMYHRTVQEMTVGFHDGTAYDYTLTSSAGSTHRNPHDVFMRGLEIADPASGAFIGAEYYITTDPTITSELFPLTDRDIVLGRYTPHIIIRLEAQGDSEDLSDSIYTVMTTVGSATTVRGYVGWDAARILVQTFAKRVHYKPTGSDLSLHLRENDDR